MSGWTSSHLSHRPTSQCIFCGGRPLSAEHVWSRWTHKYIPYDPAHRAKKALVSVSFRDRTDYERVPMPQDLRQWKVRVVCARCNNGWMSLVENRAKSILVPLFSGKQARLHPEAQTRIATWISLKTMVCEFDQLGHMVSHHTQRRRLMVKSLPPATSMAIWIGHYVRNDWIPRWICHPFLLLTQSQLQDRPDDSATYYNSQAVTYVFGELFVDVIQSSYKEIVNRLPTPSTRRIKIASHLASQWL